MSEEVHVTRGSAFGDPGASPIAIAEWTEVLTAHPEISVKNPQATFGRLGSSPVVFSQGLIAITSLEAAALPTVRAIAARLQARVFAADGLEYGLDDDRRVREVVAAVAPSLRARAGSARQTRQLRIVAGDAAAPSEIALQRAVLETARLQGREAEWAMAWLVGRANAGPGEPPATATFVAAHLLPHASAHLGAFRSLPIEPWLAEAEALRRMLEKKAGIYVVRACPSCGAKNRVALFPPAHQQPKCGRCKTALPLPR